MTSSTNPGLDVAQNTAFASGQNYTSIPRTWKIAAQHFHAASAKIALYAKDIVMFAALQALDKGA
jgi:hypothetical protein